MTEFTGQNVTFDGPVTYGGPCPEPVSGDSSRLTEEFGYALTDLEQTVESLWSRLHPVVTPSYPTTAAAAAVDAAPQVSPLRDQLHRAHAVTASLYRLIDQLEV